MVVATQSLGNRMEHLKLTIKTIICRWHDPVKLDCARCSRIFIEDHKLCNEDVEKLIQLMIGEEQ